MNGLPEAFLSLLFVCNSHGVPYPPNQVITQLTWDEDVFKLKGPADGDNWPITWVDD